MDVAEGQDHVSAAVGDAGRSSVEGGEIGDQQRPIKGAVGLLQLLDTVLAPIGGSRIKPAPAGRDIGGEDFGIPSAAGPDLDHRIGRPDPEESERLGRMPVNIASDVGGRTGGRGNCGPKGLLLRGGGSRWRCGTQGTARQPGSGG